MTYSGPVQFNHHTTTNMPGENHTVPRRKATPTTRPTPLPPSFVQEVNTIHLGLSDHAVKTLRDAIAHYLTSRKLDSRDVAVLGAILDELPFTITGNSQDASGLTTRNADLKRATPKRKPTARVLNAEKHAKPSPRRQGKR